jgi:hypothetical protein
MTDSTADTPTPSLQDELPPEDIVRRLESEDVDLDAALSLFEEASLAALAGERRPTRNEGPPRDRAGRRDPELADLDE